jgi:hypothetical protein
MALPGALPPDLGRVIHLQSEPVFRSEDGGNSRWPNDKVGSCGTRQDGRIYIGIYWEGY